MMYRTCIGCVKASSPCEHRNFLREKLAGLSITSVKFKCGIRQPPFEPGDPVSVTLYVGERPEWGEEFYEATWHAVIIRVNGSKAVAYIEPEALDESGEYNFESKTGAGYVKRPISAFTKRDAPRHVVCPTCSGVDRHLEGWTCSLAKAADPEEEYPF